MNLENFEQTNKLAISMFGGFELSYNNTKIGANINRSKKLWNLLAYMITYRNKNISQGEYIDVIWGESECTNPENALKNLLYRVRTQLTPINISNKELILSTGNSYQWNNAISCSIDIELFEQKIRLASDTSLDITTRIKLYSEAIRLYKGSFLSNHSNELWVIPLSTHYHNLFIEAVKVLANLFEQEELYEDMLSLCTYTIKIDSHDEKLHILLIRAYLNLGNNKSALDQYRVAINIIYRTLGVKPSQELKDAYKQIMATQKQMETNLSIIQSELKEHDYTSGAFICEYGFFQEAYRLEARHIERSGRLAFICLLTLTLPNGDPPSLDILNLAMERLLQIISVSLRKSDIVSKYSKAQYVMMIPANSYEACNLVIQRVVNAYYMSNKKSILKLKYNIEQLHSHFTVETVSSPYFITTRR